ncbi:MAG: SGNH/GDSL hydrolase family protein [Elusimicrobiota bacterium]
MSIKAKPLMFRAAAIALGVCAALLCCEILLRILPGFGYRCASYRAYTDRGDENKLLQRKRHSSVLGFENIPGQGRANAYGMMGREHLRAKTKRTRRILLLGDSIAEGFDNDGFEALLNRELSADLGRDYEVWNAAVGAYDVRRYAVYLERRGLAYRPDRVIIFFCLNDFDIDTAVYYKDAEGSVRYEFWASTAFIRHYLPDPFLMRHCRLYRILVMRINKALLRREEFSGLLEEDDGRVYLRRLRDLCRRKELPLMAVLFPYLKPLSEYDEHQRVQLESLRGALKDLGIRTLDLHDHLAEPARKAMRALAEDEIHPDQKTLREIGGIIFRQAGDFLR